MLVHTGLCNGVTDTRSKRGTPHSKMSSIFLLLVLTLCQRIASITSIPPSLRTHLQNKFASAMKILPEAADPLVDDIIASAPDSNGISWTRTQGEKLARFISNDRRRNSDALANGLLHGSLSVVEAISMADSQMEKICGTFDAVQLHHAALRDAVQEEQSAAEQWNRATTDERALQRYGEAALDVTRRQWARRGIDWCAHTAREHFHGDGGTRRARKFAARAHFEATGERLPDEAASRLSSALHAAKEARKAEPIRLLDVGACGHLFGEDDSIICTALDLCPQDERTYRGDFLKLRVTPHGTPPVVSGTHEEAACAGMLQSLPGRSFDAVVFSLVFSYLPLATQRAKMVAQARRLLHAGTPDGTPPAEMAPAGLLLLVDTHSSMGSPSGVLDASRGAVQHLWVQAIESLGFELVTRTALERSHALCFAAVPLEREESLGDDDEPSIARELEKRLATGISLPTRAERAFLHK